MGNIEAIPIYTKVQKYIPFFLLVIIVFNIFNVWGLALKLLGLDKYRFINPKTDVDAKLGAEIVKKRQFQIEESMRLNKEIYNTNDEKTVSYYTKDDLLLEEPDIGASWYNQDVELSNKN